MSISVIIPTLNGEKYIGDLLKSLLNQTIKIDEIIVVDSESSDNTVEIVKKFNNGKIISILRNDFNHGETRDLALKESKGDIALFMTQDVLPVDDKCIEELVKPLNDKSIAQVTARQIARDNASPREKLVRSFNYPIKDNCRNKNNIKDLGIKAYFSSNSCAAYNKDIYLKIGGFEKGLKTNEDMFYAAKAIKEGYSVAYSSKAKVYHSHNYSLKEQYDRNYIMGYEIEKHRQLLNNVKENSEGIRLVKYVMSNLLKEGHILSFLYFPFDCLARYLGNKNGRNKAKKELLNA